MKILVIQHKMIGDVLTSTILFEALRKKYPAAELHYLINPHTAAVVENNPFIDTLVLFTPQIAQSTWRFYSFLKKIRNAQYDLVIDVYGKISSVLITWFSNAPQRIAYHKDHTSFAYTDTVKRLKAPHKKVGLAIENRIKLLEPLAIEFTYCQPKIYLAAKEIEAGKQFLEAAGLHLQRPLFMLNVLGSCQRKTYPKTYMSKFIDQLVDLIPNVQLLFNFIPSQKEQAFSIFEHCQKKTQKCIHIDVFPDSLRNFLALTSHCDALLGNEGGATNMAKALNVPVFLIFCPYINKQNWFGELEAAKNRAVHIADFMEISAEDIEYAKKDPAPFWLKLHPDLIRPELELFLQSIETGYAAKRTLYTENQPATTP